MTEEKLPFPDLGDWVGHISSDCVSPSVRESCRNVTHVPAYLLMPVFTHFILFLLVALHYRGAAARRHTQLGSRGLTEFSGGAEPT